MWDLSSRTRGQTRVPCIGRQILNHWTTREALEGKLFRKHKGAIIGLPVVLFCVNINNINLDSRTRSSYESEKVKVTQLCSAVCNPMDYTVHGILQASIPEWVAFPFSRGSSQPRDRTLVSCIAGGFFTSWATRKAYVSCLKIFFFYMINVLSRDVLSLMLNQWEPRQWGLQVSTVAERQRLWTGQCLPGLRLCRFFLTWHAASHSRHALTWGPLHCSFCEEGSFPRYLYASLPLSSGLSLFRRDLSWSLPLPLNIGKFNPCLLLKHIFSNTFHFFFSLLHFLLSNMGFPWWLSGKKSACSAGDVGWIPGWGRSPGEGNGNPLLPGESHGQGSLMGLMGYSPWGRKGDHNLVTKSPPPLSNMLASSLYLSHL